MRLLGLALALAGILAAHTAHAAQLGSLSIDHAVASPSAPGQPNGAAYLTIGNGGSEADRLVSLTSPAAEAVEIHEMSDEGGRMSMRKLDAVDIAPGATVTFQQGGIHVMLIGLKEPLAAGASVPLTLNFEKAGSLTIELSVEKPADHSGHGGAHDGQMH